MAPRIDDKTAREAEVRHRQKEITAAARALDNLIVSYVRSDRHREAARFSLKTAEMWAVDGVFAAHIIEIFSDGDMGGGSSVVEDERF